MKQRPILFQGAMVRALLDGSKTQTRRIVKPQPEWTEPESVWQHGDGHSGTGFYVSNSDYPEEGALFYRCPYGQPGDQLWVREAWSPTNTISYGVMYRADFDAPEVGRWKPSIHMPRWASRIALEITGVRVERLQDISEADASAEGLLYSTERIGHWSGTGEKWFMTPVDAYRNLWESINGPGSWDANPWVWVVEFKRVEGAAA